MCHVYIPGWKIGGVASAGTHPPRPLEVISHGRRGEPSTTALHHTPGMVYMSTVHCMCMYVCRLPWYGFLGLSAGVGLQDTPTSGGTHSCVVAPGYLKQLYKELLENEDRKPFSSLPPSPPHQTPPTSSPELTPSTTLTLSPYAIHDSAHSCASCTANLKRSLYSDYKILRQSFPVSHDRDVTVKWYVPASMTRYCVMDAEKQVLERLCLPSDPASKAEANRFQEVPIFTPSVGRDSSAPLLNLSHSGFDRLHVVVTVMGELQSFMRVWPGHMIMAFPESDAKGKGQC